MRGIKFDDLKIRQIVSSNKETINEMLQNKMELIDQKDFVKLYNSFFDNRSYITAVLLLASINPLLYMPYVPNHSFAGLPITEIVLPENIQAISYGAFSYCNKLEYVYISKNIKRIEKFAFYGCRLWGINYEGTMEEWKSQVALLNAWDANSSIKKVLCSDGEIDI